MEVSAVHQRRRDFNIPQRTRGIEPAESATDK
jgi:hypothetical protein